MTQAKKHRLFRSFARFIVRMVQVFAIALLLVYLLFISGTIERRVIPFFSEQVLGVRVDLQIEGWYPLYVRGIRVYGEDNTVPVLQIDELTIRYRYIASELLPRIESVDIWRPQLYLESKDPARSNYEFLKPYFGSNDSGSDMSRWLPERIAIHEISLRTDMSEWSATLSGLSSVVQIKSMDAITVHVFGDAVHTGYKNESDCFELSSDKGCVDSTFSISSEVFKVQAKVFLPNFLALDGDASLVLLPAMQLEAAMKEVRLDAPLFADIATLYMPVNIKYDSVVIAPLKLKGAWVDSKPVIADAQCNMRMEGLLLGDEAAPWYTGDFNIEIQGEHGTDSRAVWKAILSQGQLISGTLVTDDGDIKVTANIEDWTDSTIEMIWPAPYEVWKVWLPELQHIMGGGECRFSGDNISFNGDLSSVLPSGTTAKVTGSGT
ncbi:MAG: hypothetical protein KAH38_06275, partial [Candidatus Hydrogenedentes bacterium]|nr:hypothetical protein [Candidatus Hydrogenedentota bacterium]